MEVRSATYAETWVEYFQNRALPALLLAYMSCFEAVNQQAILLLFVNQADQGEVLSTIDIQASIKLLRSI